MRTTLLVQLLLRGVAAIGVTKSRVHMNPQSVKRLLGMGRKKQNKTQRVGEHSFLNIIKNGKRNQARGHHEPHTLACSNNRCSPRNTGK